MCLHGPRVPCTVSSQTSWLSSSGTRRFNAVYAKPVFGLDLESFHPRSQPFTLRRVPTVNAVHPVRAQSPKQAVSQDFLLKFYVLLRSFSTILATWPIHRNFLNWYLNGALWPVYITKLSLCFSLKFSLTSSLFGLMFLWALCFQTSVIYSVLLTLNANIHSHTK